MKVGIVNTMDIEGGAARACYRLHQGLRRLNVDSYMIVQEKKSNEPYIISSTNKWGSFANRTRGPLDRLPTQLYRQRKKEIWSNNYVPSNKYIKKINSFSFDVIHLNWINSGYLKIEDIKKLNRPIVWTLHDMWPLTGGCHYAHTCERYLESCGKCPILNSKNINDLSKINFKRKLKLLKNKDVTIISPSNWLADEAKKSPIFVNSKFRVIPNGIDLKVFKPLNKYLAREILNLPKDKKLILFGAISSTSDRRKGYQYLIPSIQKITRDRSDVEVIIFGANKPNKEPNFGCKSHYFGVINDDIILSLLYSASDVMCVPSTQEAFGQTATEAMACGTPVVAFNTTGLKDIIDHEENGFMAEPFSIESFSFGINWILENENYEKIVNKGLTKVKNEYALEIVAKKHIDLYQEVIEEYKGYGN